MKLDTVWMVVAPENKGVIYCVGTSARGVWLCIEGEETMGTGVTAAALRKKGYRAKKVDILLAEQEGGKK